MTRDYEMCWKILIRMINMELNLSIEKEKCKIDSGEEFRKVFHIMCAINSGIKDVDAIRKDIKDIDRL